MVPDPVVIETQALKFAGALYLAGQESDIRLTQATISETANLDITTTRRWYQQIAETIVE
ncbi:hypothetical protein [Haloarcula argentinensis]|uniref:hypothetical protein n=1 Tax=Haloarcula argentinensis TaxID=43776 RepID=UPI0002B1723A|nr:hypothetical protein [Haloarcula argentinensis]EMA25661.1 transcription initiation factor IIB [Haloarcula argentinensis DSM 12282]